MPLFDAVPWPVLLAAVSLALIYALYRRRTEAFEEISLSGKEVALLTLGSIAGSAVSLPIVPFGETYLSINLGGALMPLFFAAYWIVKGKLAPIPMAVVTLVVAFVAFRVVAFDPDQGIISEFPYFFLPSFAALALALAFAWRNPVRSVPLAYVSGSIGALLGADVFNLPRVAAFYGAHPGPGRIEIGGAGVFDMVFLAGTVSMAAQLVLVLVFTRKPRGEPALHESLDPLPQAGPVSPSATLAYGRNAIVLRNPRGAWEHFVRLPDPTSLERATATLALSNLALREGDYPRSVRMSSLAVDTVVEKLPGDFPLPIDARSDLATLRAVGDVAREPERSPALTREDAGNANHTAKLLVASLAHAPGINGKPSRLEGF